MWTAAVLFLAFLQIFTPKRQSLLVRLQTAVATPRRDRRDGRGLS